MPPSPPVRKVAADYRYHVYDYDGSRPFTPSKRQPQRGDYEFYSMVQDLAGLCADGAARGVPNITLTEVGAPTAGGRRTKALSFGNPDNDRGRPTVLITGGIHAREWVATEMAYLLAEYLIVNYDPAAPSGKGQTLRDLVDSRNIHIIPMLNPDGNWFTVFGAGGDTARMWRKNRRALPYWGWQWVSELTTAAGPNPPFRDVKNPWDTPPSYEVPDYGPDDGVPPGPATYRRRELSADQTGVDLNRNLATQAFGYDCPPSFKQHDPSSETYFGPAAGSEIENANLQQYVAALGALAASIDYHSFGQLIIYPGEAANTGTVGPDFTQLGKVLDALVKTPDGTSYLLGTPLQLVKSEVTGTVPDYLAQYNRSRAFTVELDPSDHPPPVPRRQGFLLPETKILPMFQANIRGALAALGAPRRAVTAREGLPRQRAMASGASLLLGWDGVYQRGNQLPD